MTDLVLFCGPVVVTAAHRSIDWKGRDVRIVPIINDGSANAAVAAAMRSPDGRILPNLLQRYAPGVAPDNIALAAFSAGYGLVDPILQSPADRAAVTAVVLSDALFSQGSPTTGTGGVAKPGIAAFGAEAIDGSKLFVATTANSTDGSHLTGRQSFIVTQDEARRVAGCFCEPSQISPPAPVPPAPGGWWQTGDRLFWGDYTAPGARPNAGDAFTHSEHDTRVGPAVWQAYLSPWLAGERGNALWLFGAALGAALGWAWNRRRRSSP
jgi:hypothetical protein